MKKLRSRDRKFYDVSQALSEGIAVWPGDPEYRSRWAMRIAEGGSSNVSVLSIGAHTGTHVDAPLHLFNSGADIASIPVESCVGSARVFRPAVEKCITVADLLSLDWSGVKRVLFKTRSADAPESRFDPDFVSLDESAAEFLVKKRILLVGTDAPSVDPLESSDLKCHKILLGSGTVILEGVRLEEVPPGDYHLICLPLRLAGLDGSPVRAILYKKS